MNQYLEHLASQRGIASTYVDAWGKPSSSPDESKIKLLKAMGYNTESDEALSQQIDDEITSQWLTSLDPVLVCQDSIPLQFSVRVPILTANQEHTLTVNFEDGEQQSIVFTPVEFELNAVDEIDEVEYQQYWVTTDVSMPMGYHELALSLDNIELDTCRYISVPQRCYIPETINSGKKIWGLSVQLYCVRSTLNWGIGDFSDLRTLVEQAANNGADFIGLNPIHALYPSHPDACSPYGPSSRRWLNSLYIDVTEIPTFDEPEIQSWFNSSEVQNELEELRALEFIDYENVARIKYTALKKVFTAYRKKYLSKNTRQNKSFKTFVKQGGKSLETLSICEALQDTLTDQGKDAWGWPVFPEEYRDFESPSVTTFAKKHKHLVQFYQFLQWVATQQFEAASEKAIDCGMLVGLYRDLAVGVSEGSAEIWGNKELYCTDASIGAPPDVLGPLGQSWGLPPMDPQKLYEQQYQPIIDLFQANMKNSGALRIDHVLGLMRLWWVYKGDDANLGTYVHYPVDDLLGILALESVRNNSLVIGEDLGTVPQEMRDKLANNGIHSYRIFFYEKAPDGGYFSPSHYPVQSMCTLTTHDMPTLSGFWHCDDFELGRELGVYPDPDTLNDLYSERHENKQKILDTLHGHQSLPEHISRDINFVGMSTELNYSMQTHMASGSSALLSLQLEDWLQMDKPVNIPGTFKEYPNWKRKLSRNLEDIFSDQSICNLSSELSAKRQSVSED